MGFDPNSNSEQFDISNAPYISTVESSTGSSDGEITAEPILAPAGGTSTESTTPIPEVTPIPSNVKSEDEVNSMRETNSDSLITSGESSEESSVNEVSDESKEATAAGISPESEMETVTEIKIPEDAQKIIIIYSDGKEQEIDARFDALEKAGINLEDPNVKIEYYKKEEDGSDVFITEQNFIDTEKTPYIPPTISSLDDILKLTEGNYKFNDDEAKGLYDEFNKIREKYIGLEKGDEDGELVENMNDAKDRIEIHLLDETKEKIDANKDMTVLTAEIDKKIGEWQEAFKECANELGLDIEKILGIDLPGVNDTASPKDIKSSGGSGGSRGGTSYDTGEVTDIMAGTVVSAISLAGAIVGTVKFKEIVTLFETIGAPTGVQASLTGNYALIGIVKNNGKNYYKILDKDKNKIYYAEISDKIEINTDLNKLLEVNDKTMMLTTTDIGTSNFAKFADNNTLYFVQNEIQRDELTFANVLDSTDGNDYYVPLSDSSKLVSLESIVNSNESGSK